MATKQKNTGDLTEVKDSEKMKKSEVESKSKSAAPQVEKPAAPAPSASPSPTPAAAAKSDAAPKEGTSRYPAVRVLSGSELDAYKNQKVDGDKAERFLAQKDKEEYWRNKKEQKRKKTED